MEVKEKEWFKLSDQYPKEQKVYEWRVKSKAVDGLVIIVAAWMRERGAGYSTVLSPAFDYWDGYQLHILQPVEWRESEGYEELKSYQQKVIEVEGIEPCNCLYCGAKPKYSAMQRDSYGTTVNPYPWNYNSWRFECCQWGSTPWMKDPREIENIRQKAIVSALALAKGE